MLDRLCKTGDGVLPALQQAFRVLRYDLRGFGMSEKVKTLRLDDMLGDIAGLLDALAITDPCHIAMRAQRRDVRWCGVQRHQGTRHDRPGADDSQRRQAACYSSCGRAWPCATRAS